MKIGWQYYYAATLIVSLLIGRGILMSFQTSSSALRDEQQRSLAAQNVAWAQEDAKRAEEALERQKAREHRLVEALGGPLAAVAKDPELNILEMFRQSAIACSPTGTVVSVAVDRFTEYDVALTLPEALAPNSLAGIAQSLLKNGGPYIHDLRLLQGDRLLGYLDYTAIESVSNWSTATLGEVEGLLAANDESSAKGSSDASGENTAAVDLSPMQAKVRDAQRTFSDHYQEHVRRLNQLVTELSRASRLETIQSSAQFQSQMTWLDQTASQLEDERKFFRDPASELEQLLGGQELDPLLIRILKRGAVERIASPLAYDNLFVSVSGYLNQTRTFLSKMDNWRGEWGVDPQAGMVHFSSANAQSAYVTYSALVQQSAQQVQQAIRAVSDYQPARQNAILPEAEQSRLWPEN
jgi:hypothetical protein